MSDLLSECSETSFISDFEDEFHSLNIDISNGPPIDRIEQLTDICRTLRIDVLILSESKLDQTIPNNLITLPGYHEPL